MNINLWIGLLIPFVGTSLGALMVLFMKCQIQEMLQRILIGFAAGVMVSASFWSLLIPAVEQSKQTYGRWAFVPEAVGFCLGMLFLLLIDTLVPIMHLD